MLKAELIRSLLQSTSKDLNTNPDKLELFIDEGVVVSAGATSSSYELQYTLNIIVRDFNGSPNMIFAPIMDFIRENQPDLIHNPDKRKDGFRFIADHNNHDSIDLSIFLKLTERISVKEENGKNIITHLDEPSSQKYQEIIEKKTEK
ncbi:phage tail protein [Histophilus somni]|uniref:Putative tail synthesis protein n=1 Tax=Histophilus somni TaxID=731 RepID=Q48286_HISSO|nr:phage tail protein [Histophilus somni]AAC45164.1 putative tail synthesis protein [Histophilus somni]ACA30882.1 P2 phage tail completion R family protein [Histophilus somni 2336]